MPHVKIDQVDRVLLRRLQEDARVISADLGEEVGLSAAAVQRRVKRLRDVGVIERDVSVVNPVAIGIRMHFVVHVELERESTDVLQRLERAFEAEPLVQQCFYVTGEADLILVIASHDMDEFEALSRSLLFRREIRRFKTHVVMRRVKTGSAFAMDDPEGPI